ncbi:uncharacterized protein LOC131258180 isoform X1 [Magnolia sinica]|uniref:uncharacterized protein LOC131258180 isoform X1 n=1 Tax=Magnolia sinica TaxID=86752 RepID=UPI00265836FA|nr:uncharacterized protein LOC131258180 isoform X1 [Magnolia sinica]
MIFHSEAESFGAEPLGDAAPADADPEDARGRSSSSSSKKRGPTRGSELHERTSVKRVIGINEFGQPNIGDANQIAFNSSIGVLTRAHIPITYTDFRLVPPQYIQRVSDILACSYEFQDNQEAWSPYIRDRCKAAWRNFKNTLHAKYIKDKDPAVVKSYPAPIGVPLEDWMIFVDYCNTNKFKESSVRNASNWAKQVGTSTLGRRSMAATRHEMAIERNLTTDAEVGRAEVYIRAHTTKDNKVQFLETFEKIKSIQSSNPASRMTSVDDALTQSIGSDSRGRMQGIGGNVGKITLKKTIPIVHKLGVVSRERDNLVDKLDEMQKSLGDLHQKFQCFVDKQGEQGDVAPPTIPPFKSSHASSPDLVNLGKRCDLCDWKKRVIARGEVHAVDPKTCVHGAEMDDGNFSVVLMEIIAPQSELWKEDGYHDTLGEVYRNYTSNRVSSADLVLSVAGSSAEVALAGSHPKGWCRCHFRGS